MVIIKEERLAYWWPQDGTCPLKSARRVRTLTIEKRKQRYTEDRNRKRGGHQKYI